MKTIGEVKRGANTVIDVFKDYLLNDGLFLISTLTYKETRKTLLYDVNESKPCIGIIPVLGSERKDGFRSINPTHSMIAFGKKAEEYIKGEEKQKNTNRCKWLLG